MFDQKFLFFLVILAILIFLGFWLFNHRPTEKGEVGNQAETDEEIEEDQEKEEEKEEEEEKERIPSVITITGLSAEWENQGDLIADVDCQDAKKGCRVTLGCTAPDLDCGKIYFCLDQENTCEPIILFTEPFFVKAEGINYIRYYSIEN